MKGVFLSEITSEEAQSLIHENSIVVLPIGGGVKEHGGHLPMGTDYFVTDWLAKQVTERCEVVTLPTLPYAYFPALVEWKGSVSVEAEHFSHFVEDILHNYIRFGVKKFLIIDGGISTHIPLMISAATLGNRYGVKVAVSCCAGLGQEVDDALCQQAKGGHGDEAETSTMLYIREDLVHMDKTVEEYFSQMETVVRNGIKKIYLPGHADTPHGTNGNSTLATKEKGEAMMWAKVDDLVAFLEEFKELKV